MQNPNPQHDSALVVIGGLVAEVNAPNLPAGAAAIATDVDFTVGSVRTRDGLSSVYVYEGADEENNAGLGINVAVTGGVAWNNPDNIINDAEGTYASVQLNNATPPVLTPGIGPFISGATPTTGDSQVISISGSQANCYAIFIASGNRSLSSPYEPDQPGYTQLATGGVNE